MISKTKLNSIRCAVRTYISNEMEAEQEDHDHVFNDDEVRNEAIWECAMKLGLQEATVERYWDKFEMQEL